MVAEPDSSQTAIFKLSDTDRRVEPFFDEIYPSFAIVRRDSDIGMQLHELRQQGG